MKILIEIRNYLLKVTGAITDIHVQAWRRRRMCAKENPLEVFAKVKDEAICIEQAGVLNFQADRELYSLVTRKHTDGGAFFGNILWDKVSNKVDQVLESRGYLTKSPDMYMEIATVWAHKAHHLFTTASSKDMDFYHKMHADLALRGKPPTWATTDQIAAPPAAVPQAGAGGKQPGKGGAQAAQCSPAGQKPKYFCEFCQKEGHSTDRCRARNALAQQAAGQQLALPAPPPVVSTVTPHGQMTRDCGMEAWLPSA
jgi:hypothetical protein